MNKEKMGLFLKKLRKEKKLSLEELSNIFQEQAYLTVSVNAISNWERGKTIPDIDNLNFLAGFYNISIDEILNGEIKKPSQLLSEYKSVKEIYPLAKYSILSFIGSQGEWIEIYKRVKILLFKFVKQRITYSEKEELTGLFGAFFDFKNNLSRPAFLRKIKEMYKRMDSDESFWWETKKLFTFNSEVKPSFDLMLDGNPDVINKCLKGLDDWQKDLFLNTIKYQGEGFSENKRKMLLKALLDNGAKVVDTFAFRVKVIQETKTEIIDKIEKLYYSINKPFEFIVANNDGKKHLIKIPNAPYNRLVIEEDHFVKEMAIHGYDLDTFYKLLEENEKMPKEVLSEICRINDTSIEDFYNNPNEDSYLPNIVLFWDDIRKKVFRDDSTKKEINELLTKLENGERFIYKTVVESSSDYNSQCQHIFSVLDDTTYDDYLAMRNNKKTDDLIKEVDKLSIYSIISKYFGVKDNE